MATFSGQLRSNEIFSALYNMIISQEVFADNIGKHQTLVDKARVDGGLFGDTKLYYSTDVLESAVWGNDAEATNLLALHRPDAPAVQAIILDQFRQISLTVDNYLSKRAWGSEGAFSQFNSVLLGWLRETKRVYDGTLYNAFIGTNETSVGEQVQEIDLTSALTGLSGLEASKTEALTIAQAIADLIVSMGDYSRDFNDNQFLRSYDEKEIKVIWNSAWVNKIRKVDLPTIFHKDGLVDKFDGDVLPARYFGEVQGAVTAGNNDGTYRSLFEADYTVGGKTTHVFAGDLIPSGVAISANASYKVDDDIVCKIVVKLPPYMSAFEVGTSFFNPKSLTENHYLTFGHNTLEHLANYPFVTVKVK